MADDAHHDHDEDEWDGVPKKFGVPAYAQFDTTIGDEYHRCDQDIRDNGTVFAVADVGKRHVEAICATLRQEGFRVDWHAVRNTVCLKTLEVDARLAALQVRWRECVRAVAIL